MQTIYLAVLAVLALLLLAAVVGTLAVTAGGLTAGVVMGLLRG